MNINGTNASFRFQEKLMKTQHFILFGILASFVFNVDSAMAATRVQFARGSYCGVYSGNFSGGKEFVL